MLVMACTRPTPTRQLPLWTVYPTPLLTIGVSESDPGHELAGVTGGLHIAGGIIVANSGSHELRRFDSTGRYLGASGRRGQGPGDFGPVINLFPAPGDSLYVFDAVNLRWTVHGGNGEYARVLPGGAEALPKPVWLYHGMVVETPAPGTVPEWALTALDSLPELSSAAPLRRARFDDLGFLWVSDSVIPNAWTVMGSAAPIARVMLPAGLELFQTGPNFLIGLERDSMDRELVRMYRLGRPQTLAHPAREPVAVIPREDNPAARGMIADFRNIMTAQEAFYSKRGHYAAHGDSLGYTPASGAKVIILHGTTRRWAALLYDRKSRTTCAVSVGFPAPGGWIDGSPFCGM
jgi:hypothetical protein